MRNDMKALMALRTCEAALLGQMNLIKFGSAGKDFAEHFQKQGTKPEHLRASVTIQVGECIGRCQVFFHPYYGNSGEGALYLLTETDETEPEIYHLEEVSDTEE